METQKRIWGRDDKVKVLLIDDNTQITEMMTEYLTLKGLDCVVSNDGREGLNNILSNNYDVIILDIAMPEFSGIDIIRFLEKKRKLQEYKIIILTASSVTDEEIADLLERGVLMALKKPIDLSHFLDIIKNCAQIQI